MLLYQVSLKLRVFAELPDSVMQDFDQLQVALLAAYELSAEHYRKKFRDIRKLDSENFADFALKMQIFFKRWLQNIDSYEDVDKLRQTLLMEQFLQTVSVELKIWLVYQKPKTVDEMARLADQYVALRKQATSTQQTSTETQQFVAHNSDTSHKAQTKFRSYEHKSRSPPLHRKQFTQNKSQAPATETERLFCAFCKKANHTISKCKKLKYMQEEDEKSRASVNTNSYASPIESNVVSTEKTDNNIHSLLKPCLLYTSPSPRD